MATYTLTLQAADSSEVVMGATDASMIETNGGLRMSPAAIKVLVDAGDTICVKLFDNAPGLPVLSVVEV